MEECGMKSRSPVTRQGDGGGAGWGAPSVRTPGCSGRVTAQPELCLCLAPHQRCAVLQTALCLATSHCTHHHHTSVGNTANGTHKITLRITCTWLAWLGCTVLNSEYDRFLHT